MLVRIAAVAVAFGCIAPCARADPFEDFDEAPLAACVVAANGERTAVRACVGEAALPCIDAGGGATMLQSLCWDNEASWWERRARDVAARLETVDPERITSLHASNGVFEAFVDRECSYRASTFQGGSGAQPAMAVCAAELWSERFIMLGETASAY